MSGNKLNSKYMEEGIYNCGIKKKFYFQMLILASLLLKIQSGTLYIISFIIAVPDIDCHTAHQGLNLQKSNIKCEIDNVCDWNNKVISNLNTVRSNFTVSDFIDYSYNPATSN